METAPLATANGGTLASTSCPRLCATARCRPQVRQLGHDTALVHGVVSEKNLMPRRLGAFTACWSPSCSSPRQRSFLERGATLPTARVYLVSPRGIATLAIQLVAQVGGGCRQPYGASIRPGPVLTDYELESTIGELAAFFDHHVGGIEMKPKRYLHFFPRLFKG
jgi:hypothetical protein